MSILIEPILVVCHLSDKRNSLSMLIYYLAIDWRVG